MWVGLPSQIHRCGAAAVTLYASKHHVQDGVVRTSRGSPEAKSSTSTHHRENGSRPKCGGGGGRMGGRREVCSTQRSESFFVSSPSSQQLSIPHQVLHYNHPPTQSVKDVQDRSYPETRQPAPRQVPGEVSMQV